MIKNIISIQFLINFSSHFSTLKKKITDQDTVFHTQIPIIIKKINETSNHIENYRKTLDKSLKSLDELNFIERIKPDVWLDVYNKLQTMGHQSDCLSGRLHIQYNDLKKRYFYLLLISPKAPEFQVSPYPSTTILNGNVHGKRPHSNISDWVDFHEMCNQVTLYYKCSRTVSRIPIFFIILALISIVILTFFKMPIVSFFTSHFNIKETTLYTVLEVLRILSYIILLFSALVIVVFCIKRLVLISNLEKEYGNKQMQNKFIKILIFLIGIAFLVSSIWSQQILLFVTSLLGVKNMPAIPQAATSLVSLVIALFFLLWSLYHSTIIKNILISSDLEKKYEEYKSSILVQLDKLKKDFEDYKIEAITLSESNTSAIHELERRYYERIQVLESKISEKIQQFERNQMESIYECKLEFSSRLERMKYDLDDLHKKVDEIDTYIEKLSNFK